MSAAASGHEISFTVIEPTILDLNQLRLGTRLVQRKRITGSAHDTSSYWYVKKVDAYYYVQPYRGLHVGDERKFTESQMHEFFTPIHGGC